MFLHAFLKFDKFLLFQISIYSLLTQMGLSKMQYDDVNEYVLVALINSFSNDGYVKQ